MSDLPYRTNVAAVLVRDDLVLLGQRFRYPDLWQLPQGGVEPGESLEEALLREISEELGISSPSESCSIEQTGPTLCYEWPPQVSEHLRARFRGQRQTLFLVRFEGDDALIDPSRDANPEFRAFEWFEPQDAVARCWEVKRPNLVAALESFRLL